MPGALDSTRNCGSLRVPKRYTGSGPHLAVEVKALLDALTGWDNTAVMPPRCDVCPPDLAGVGGPTSVAQPPGTRRWAVADDRGRRGAAYVAQRLQACFGDGRSSGVRVLGRRTEASRAEFAA